MKRFAFFLIALSVFFLMESQTNRTNTTLVYPFRTKLIQFSSQQQLLHMTYMYEKANQGKNKTVLLLHGKNFSGTYWGNVMKRLLANGYDVVAPDQVGFGQSSNPANYQFSFQQLAQNTRMLLDTLGIKQVILLGHSMGGMLATRFTLMYPERVTQLVLEDPIGLEDWKLVVPYTPVDSEYKVELNKTRESIKQYMMENYFHNEWKKEYDPLLNSSTHTIGTPEASRISWNMALTSDMIFTQPVCYEFDKLKVPTVLIIGQKDRTAIGKEKVSREKAEQMGNYPELGRAAAAKIPNSTLIEMPNSGHIPHIEEFDLFMKNLLDVLPK